MTISDDHADWLEARGLSVELAAKYGIRSQGPRIAVPYLREQQMLYAKAIDPNEKSNTRCLPSGIDQTTLWNLDSLKGAGQVGDLLVITEGEWDALACLQVGEAFVVSLPSGAANTIEGARSKAERVLLEGSGDDRQLHRLLEPFRRVVVMTDCDHDGLLMRRAIIEIIGQDYCYIPEYPHGCKDANDVLRQYGEERLAHVILSSQPVRQPCFEPITHGLHDGPPVQLPVGMPLLDGHLVLSRPEFMIVGGPAGSGKSTVQQIVLINLLANNPGLKASIFHGEGHRSIVTKRFMTWWRHHVDSNTGDPEVQDRRNRWLDDRLSFIRPPQGEMPTFDWLLWAMEVHALHFKRDVLVVDPWNEILHTRDPRKSMTDHIGECIIKMKALASRLNLILIVTHHIAKPKERNAPPTAYDLADSAHWANKADHILLVWRPKNEENSIRLEVAKSKDHELLGRPGYVWASLHGATFDLAAADPPEGYH